MKSKLIQIPYTIGIVKPHLVLRDEQVSLILVAIGVSDFCVRMTDANRVRQAAREPL